MRRGRSVTDQEGLRRVLLLCGVLLAVAGVGVGAFGIVNGGWGLVVAPLLVAVGVVCVVVSRDDGRGVWCPECVARNPETAAVCESCGTALD